MVFSYTNCDDLDQALVQYEKLLHTVVLLAHEVMPLEQPLPVIESPLKQVNEIIQKQLLEANIEIQHNLIAQPVIKLAVNFRQEDLDHLKY